VEKTFKIVISVLVAIALIGVIYLFMQQGNNNAPASMNKAQVKNTIHSYLLDNPAILIQMSQKLQAQEQQKQQQQANSVIKQNADKIFNPKNNPIVGNKNGKVTLVEFFDYQCIHCENMYPVVQKLMKANPNLRVVFYDFPIFGEPSQYAAFAALYAHTQGKYLAMHDALFAANDVEGKMTDAKVNVLAKKVGLNLVAMKSYIKTQMDAMKAKKNMPNGVMGSFELAQLLHIQGTPAFIIAPTPSTGNPAGKTTFIPGASDGAALQQAINDAK
tara:strand:+ start:8495 stop:9313 length:819 start_codon:yes stop_codon:yes gene_type:complete